MSALYARVYHRLSRANRYATSAEWRDSVQAFCVSKFRRSGGGL